MPILKPDIQRVLQAAGLEKGDEESIQELLTSNNLDKSSLLTKLQDIIEVTESDAIKLRAVELSLKLHGLLKDQAPAPASVTIIIKDPNNISSSVSAAVNPVIIPRQLKNDGETIQ